ncbi:MAG: tetratricopeptide repeat protein [Rhodospirillales bacterium]
MLWRIVIVTLIAAGAVAAVFWLVPKGEREATRNVDYVQLARTLAPKAQAGDAQAQFDLAHLYETGKGVARDGKAAAAWYQRAAQQGMVRAQFALGQLYDKGEAVTADPLRAIRWYELSIRQGNLADAKFAIGLLYYRGRGVLKDFNEAVSWFRRAANQGHPCAQFLMGGVYEAGSAVDLDRVEAYKWYTLAIPGRQRCLAMNPRYDAIAARKRLTKRMTEFDVKKGEERAAAWRPGR